jgi:hypothetical protein
MDDSILAETVDAVDTVDSAVSLLPAGELSYTTGYRLPIGFAI